MPIIAVYKSNQHRYERRSDSISYVPGYFFVCRYRRFGGACYKNHVLHALEPLRQISRAIRTLNHESSNWINCHL